MSFVWLFMPYTYFISIFVSVHYFIRITSLYPARPREWTGGGGGRGEDSCSGRNQECFGLEPRCGGGREEHRFQAHDGFKVKYTETFLGARREKRGRGILFPNPFNPLTFPDV